jgi:penicillin amidase
MQGTTVANWQWGKAHMATSIHRPFSNVAPLAKVFEVVVPTGGDPWTVNVGQYWLNEKKQPFANRHAASLRAVYDLANLDASQFIYQTGQSGLALSGRYRDMSEEWAAVKYRTLSLNPSSFAHQATLQP